MKYTILILLLLFFAFTHAQDQEQYISILPVCSSTSISLNALLFKNIDNFSRRFISLPKNVISVIVPWGLLHHHKLLDDSPQHKDLGMILISSLLTDFFLSGLQSSLKELMRQFLWNWKDVTLVFLTILTHLDTSPNNIKTILISLLFAREIASFLGDLVCKLSECNLSVSRINSNTATRR